MPKGDLSIIASNRAMRELLGVKIVHLKRGAAAKRPRAKPKQRESSIENSIVRWCKAEPRMSLTRKMNGFGYNSWPDRQVFPPGNATLAHLVKEKRPLLLEVKRPGEEATTAQKTIHEELRAAGQAVYVVHSLQAAQDAYHAHFKIRRF